MKVEQLYIIGIEMDDEDQDKETKSGLHGLKELYSMPSSSRKAANVDTVFLHISQQEALHTGKLSELCDLDGKPLPQCSSSNVGVYVYMHGASGLSCAWFVGPGQLAPIIKLLPCKPEALRKICIIGCSLAQKPCPGPIHKTPLTS